MDAATRSRKVKVWIGNGFGFEPTNLRAFARAGNRRMPFLERTYCSGGGNRQERGADRHRLGAVSPERDDGDHRARNEAQLKENLGATGWKLTPAQVARLEAASAKPRTYPYWHQAQFAERNPFPTA